MVVQDLLLRKTSDTIVVESVSSVAAAAHLLIRHGIGGLPVVAPTGGPPLGFVSERDVVRAVDHNGGVVNGLTVERIMRRPAPVCSATDSLYDVMSRMTRERLRHLVVMDGDRVAGVISVGDLVKYRLEQLETETGVLRDYVAAQRAIT